MARPPQTAAQRQQMRDRILDTAVDILTAEGPDALSTRAIAARLDMAHMTLYTYFANQTALLRALRDRETERWWAEQERISQRTAGEPVWPVVEALLGQLVTFAREKPHLHRLAWIMSEKGVESRAEYQARQRLMVGQLAALLHEGMEAGEFDERNAVLAAGTILAMVNTPFILTHSGKVADTAVRDLMVGEILTMVRLYLGAKR